MRGATSGPQQTCASFVDAILFHAVKAPSSLAIGLESGALSYGQLAAAIFSAAERCRKIGLAPGSIVGLIVNDPVWHICLVAALYRLGVVTTSITTADISAFPAGSLAAVLHDGRAPERIAVELVAVTPDWFTAPTAVSYGSAYAFGPDELCRIALSSGTTGVPKPIALSAQVIWDRLTTYTMRGRFAASERIYCGPQFTALFGFAISFGALLYGKMVCFSDNAPAALPVMEIYRAELAVLSVHQLSGLVEVKERSPGGLGALREIQAGGALISDSLVERARAYLPASIVSTYASTEAGTVAVAPVDLLGPARNDGAVGFVTPWASVEACDDDGRTLPLGQEGNLRIRALGLAPIYDMGMKNVPAPESFYPGDAGRVLGNGLLIVAGRTAEVINVGGNKISPDKFEHVILQCQGIKDAAVFTVDIGSALPQVWAAVVTDSTMNMAEVMKRCADTPLIGTPAVIKVVKAIPRNNTGKIMRDQLRKELANAGSHGGANR